jgi:DNA-binding NarL/FixJ family response regulator
MNRQRTAAQGVPSISVALGCCADLVCRGLVQVLQDDKQIALIARDLDRQALKETIARRAPLVVVVEEGMIATRHLRELASSTAVMVLTHKPTLRRRRTLEASGAICVSLQATSRELLTEIRLAARGRAEPLTPREQEVLGHLRVGQTTAQEIADQMQISVATVRTHIATIRRKYGVKSKRELIASDTASPKRQ